MPTIDEWFQRYAEIRAGINGLHGRLDQIRDNLGAISDQVRDGAVPELKDLAASLNGIKTSIKTLSAGFKVDVKPLEDALGLLTARINADPAIDLTSRIEILGRKLGSLDLPVNLAIEDLALVVKQALGGLGEGIGPLAKLVDELTKEGSPSAIAALRGAFGQIAAWVSREPVTASLATVGLVQTLAGDNLDGLVAWLQRQTSEALAKAINLSRPIMSALEIPLEVIFREAIDTFRKELEATGQADPAKVRDVAAAAIGKAYALGQGAHFLAIAAEMWPPLKSLGLSQAAAALSDMAGFKEISGRVSGATIGAAITRPMRWWGNMTFSPEIPSVRDLVELVQKREIDLETYAGFMQMQGFRQEDIDIFTRAVWREPTLRDLGVVIEDVSVDEAFLLKRVQRAGYEDADAEKLTGALVQRIIKSSRAVLISAARSAVADGTLDQDAFRTMLEGMGLREDIIGFETRAADIQARRDYIRDAIATYRRQYINDAITRSELQLTLSALGVAPDRADLILADADAARDPRIAREEERAIEDAVREIQRELVPRYRRLFELGAIDEGQYQAILVDAGISPAVAAQAVILDRQKRDLIAQKSGSLVIEREVDRLVNETEEALRLQFRKGLIDLEDLGAQLANLGISPARVRAIQDQERARAIKPPGRPIPTPEEAKARIINDLGVQTALNDFRKGRIEPLDLYDALVNQGVDPDEALARVNLEISRLPAPKG